MKNSTNIRKARCSLLLRWARRQRRIRPREKFLLFVLAAYHVDKTGFGRPKLRELARDTGQCPETVRFALKKLERHGLISRTFNVPGSVPDLQLLMAPIKEAS